MIPLSCPSCGGPLILSDEWYECQRCGRLFGQTLGIPDLRDTSSHLSKEEACLIERMCEFYPTASFADLLRLRFSNAPTTEPLLAYYMQYNLCLGERGRKMFNMLQAVLEAHLGQPERGLALDLGCGKGSSTVSMAQVFDEVCGLDPSLPELLLAKKYLETQGVTNVILVQGFGQHLPFPSETFDYVNAQNVLEHVFDLETVLSEVHRTLGRDGCFCGDSRNRFDLFLPEPHVRLRWVGYWPRRWMGCYVRWRRGVDYEATYLLSYAELKQELRQHFGSHQRIVFPRVATYGAPAWVDRALSRIQAIPLLREALLWVFPVHLALAQRV